MAQFHPMLLTLAGTLLFKIGQQCIDGKIPVGKTALGDITEEGNVQSSCAKSKLK